MKKYLSVFGLAARSSFWKALAVIVLSVVLAGLLLFLLPEGKTESYTDGNGQTQTVVKVYSPSKMVETSLAAIPLAVGFGALCAVLCRTGWGKNAMSGYTMQRLRVKKNTACMLWAAYNFMMMALFWTASALVMLGVMNLRVNQFFGGGESDALALILACYRTPLLHHLLPVGDWIAWLGNIFGILGCAVGCVDVARKKWKGQMGGIALAIALAATLGGCALRLSSGGTQIMMIIGEIGLIGIVAYNWRGGDENERDVWEPEHS